MKKGRKGVILCLLVTVVFVMPISAVKNEVKNVVFATEITIDNDCGCSETKFFNDGFFNCPGIVEITEPILTDEVSPRPAVIETPSYFNWMDHEDQDWTTSIKEQTFPKWCGSCWAFSALGALECVINIREGIPDLDPDLSEQYLLSCLPRAGGCDGGQMSSAFYYIIKNDSKGNYCNGIIPEACFPYEADDDIPCDAKCDNWEDYLIPVVDYGTTHGYPEVDKDLIKSHIMQYGPVAAGMVYDWNFSLWELTHHSPDDYFPYQEEGGVGRVGHGIVIVGWKDDPSIGQGGYWICKNSEGMDRGYNGFFNIEYDSNYIAQDTVWVDYDPESYDWHPVPKANGPYFGLVDDPVHFQGDASGERPPFTYHWDFGDESSSEDQNPTHAYTSEGEYTVTLTVTDDQGNSFYDKTYAWIQETNQPPHTPILDGPNKITAGELYSYNLTLYDPDTPIIYYIREIFGYDVGVWSDPWLSSDEKQLWGWYAPEERGKFTIRWKVKDPYGAESDWAELTVRVTKTYENPLYTLMEKLFNWLEQLFERDILPGIFNF